MQQIQNSITKIYMCLPLFISNLNRPWRERKNDKCFFYFPKFLLAFPNSNRGIRSRNDMLSA